MTAFAVPGYDVVELLGFGGSGEVWLARSAASGEPVALKRLRTPGDLAGRDRLRREAAVLTGITHPHVLRLRTVVSAGDDLVLVLDHAAGGSLARLVAGRGALAPGEVVTVATPLLQALAEVHAQGVVHGDVSPGNVLFAGDGRPLLADLGVARLVGEPARDIDGTADFVDPAVAAGARPGPASDVYGLAAVCRWALGAATGPDGEAVAAVLDRAHDPDPVRRPAAAELAVAVWDACGPVPVRLLPVAGAGAPALADLPGPVPVTHRVRPQVEQVAEEATGGVWPARARHGRPRPGATLSRAARTARPARPARMAGKRWRAVAVAVTLAVGTAGAVLTGLAWADAGGRETAGVRLAAREPSAVPVRADPQAAPVRWAEVLTRLDQARESAFAVADPAALAAVYAPGAPALARDRETLQRLVAAGVRARGFRLQTRAVAVVTTAADRVVLRVRDDMAPYQLVGADGRVVDSRRGRPAADWTITLARVGGDWRVYDVARG